MNGSVQETAGLDDHVPERAACRTEILLLYYYSVVYL